MQFWCKWCDCSSGLNSALACVQWCKIQLKLATQQEAHMIALRWLCELCSCCLSVRMRDCPSVNISEWHPRSCIAACFCTTASALCKLITDLQRSKRHPVLEQDSTMVACREYRGHTHKYAKIQNCCYTSAAELGLKSLVACIANRQCQTRIVMHIAAV